ncbi:MAG: O-antigen ligase family protein [bacterium]|nr:O-antigen ligase family protein [bacterium]
MALNNFLRNSVVVGIFALPFIPLFVSSELFFPFISGKNFAFRILIELMAAAYLLLAFRDASYRPKRTWMLVAYAAFMLIIAVADVFGENFYRSFWSNYERMEGLIAHLHFFAYFVMAGTVLTTEKLWTRFWQTSIFVSALLGFYGIFQLSGRFDIHQGGVRLDATLGNATYLAAYMLFHAFITALLFAREAAGSKMRWVYGALIALQLFILYYTATRGAMLGLLGGGVVVAALAFFLNRGDRRVRKLAAGAIAAVIVLAGGVYLFKDTSFVRESPVLSRFASISLSETTTKSRFLIWNMSLEGVKEHPLLGYGQENYIIVFNKQYDPRMYAQEPWFDRAHNVFFDWLIAGGILGLLAYLSLFGVALYYLLVRDRDSFSAAEKSIFIGLLAAYFFQNVFVFDNFTSYFLFASVLAYLAFRAEGTTAPALAPSFAPPPAVARLFAPAVLVTTLLVLYFANVRPIMAGATLIEALSPHQEGLGKNLELFEKSIAYGTFGRGEAREQLIQAAIRVQTPAAPVEVRQRFFETARREMLIHIDENPKDARYELFLGSFLNKFGMYDEALAHLERARELSPKKQSILFETASSYLGKREYTKALALLKEAYELEPSFVEARLLYGMGALYARNDALAAELLVPAYGTLLIPDDRVINAYAARGEYGKVAELWKLRIQAEPNNINYHGALAASYFKMGRVSESIAALRKISAIEPSLKEQVEDLVRRIQAGENVF